MKQIMAAAAIVMALAAPRVAVAEELSVRLFLGADCAGCETWVLEALARNDGVTEVEIDFKNQWILVFFDTDLAPTDQVVKALADTLYMYGYSPVVLPIEGA